MIASKRAVGRERQVPAVFPLMIDGKKTANVCVANPHLIPSTFKKVNKNGKTFVPIDQFLADEESYVIIEDNYVLNDFEADKLPQYIRNSYPELNFYNCDSRLQKVLATTTWSRIFVYPYYN